MKKDDKMMMIRDEGRENRCRADGVCILLVLHVYTGISRGWMDGKNIEKEWCVHIR